MHDGCTKTSIARSHTIPLSGSLRLIAEDGHVLTPRVGESGLQLVHIGVRQGFNFPRLAHEAEFAIPNSPSCDGSKRIKLIRRLRLHHSAASLPISVDRVAKVSKDWEWGTCRMQLGAPFILSRSPPAFYRVHLEGDDLFGATLTQAYSGGTLAEFADPCLYRKLNSAIMVVKATDDRLRCDAT